MSPEPKVRGLTFLNSDAAFAELFGDVRLLAARARMQPALATTFRQGMLPGAWYPISWYRDFHQALRAAAGDPHDLQRQLGLMSARREMSVGLHKRLLAYLVSPQTLLSMSSNVFHTYFDTGHFDITRQERGYARAEASGCIGWDRNLWQVSVGFSEGLLQIAGAQNLLVRLLGGGEDGDETADYEGRWSP